MTKSENARMEEWNEEDVKKGMTIAAIICFPLYLFWTVFFSSVILFVGVQVSTDSSWLDPTTGVEWLLSNWWIPLLMGVVLDILYVINRRKAYIEEDRVTHEALRNMSEEEAARLLKMDGLTPKKFYHMYRER